MTKGNRIAVWAGVAYLAIGIVTFGHSAAGATAANAADLTACRDREKSNPKELCIDIDDAPLSGMASAVLWPFYWSWEAWS
jgi:hypothetical protein